MTISPRSLPEFWGNLASNKTRRSARRSPKRYTRRSTASSSGTKTRNMSNASRKRRKRQWKKEEQEILEDYRVPDLRLRKGIWENFPVILDKVDDGNGVDRYAVMWHNKNLQQWMQTKPQSSDEAQEYPRWVETRLRYALKRHPKQYKILPSRNPGQLMVIEMVFKKK